MTRVSISLSLLPHFPASFPASALGFVNTGAAFLIGVIGSVVCSAAQELMERYGKKYITDTSEVFVCHGVSKS